MNSTRTIYRAYKTELDPNATQRANFAQHAGACRFLYNLALERCRLQYELAHASGRAQHFPSAMSLGLELTALKRTECPWLNEVGISALQNALRQCEAAYQNFFRRLRQGKTGKAAGYPRFKSKRQGLGAFKVNGKIRVGSSSIQLPKLGTVRLKERNYLPVAGVRITSATVSERAGRWYVSVQVGPEVRECAPANAEVIGVDLGLAHLATLSDGIVITAHKASRGRERKLKRLQRSLSRKQKGSNNRNKARKRVARAHARIAHIRSNMTHEATTAIAKRYGIVVLEDLNVAGMMRNQRLAKAVSDAALGEFHRQLAYKMNWAGGTMILANRWFPSSKLCSQCGAIKEDLRLADRVYRCDCGLVIDRDLNAAINLRNVAVKHTETLNACGATATPSIARHVALSQERASAEMAPEVRQPTLWEHLS